MSPGLAGPFQGGREVAAEVRAIGTQPGEPGDVLRLAERGMAGILVQAPGGFCEMAQLELQDGQAGPDRGAFQVSGRLGEQGDGLFAVQLREPIDRGQDSGAMPRLQLESGPGHGQRVRISVLPGKELGTPHEDGRRIRGEPFGTSETGLGGVKIAELGEDVGLEGEPPGARIRGRLVRQSEPLQARPGGERSPGVADAAEEVDAGLGILRLFAVRADPVPGGQFRRPELGRQLAGEQAGGRPAPVDERADGERGVVGLEIEPAQVELLDRLELGRGGKNSVAGSGNFVHRLLIPGAPVLEKASLLYRHRNGGNGSRAGNTSSVGSPVGSRVRQNAGRAPPRSGERGYQPDILSERSASKAPQRRFFFFAGGSGFDTPKRGGGVERYGLPERNSWTWARMSARSGSGASASPCWACSAASAKRPHSARAAASVSMLLPSRQPVSSHAFVPCSTAFLPSRISSRGQVARSQESWLW